MVASKTNMHVFGHWEEAGAHANVQHANSMLLGDSDLTRLHHHCTNTLHQACIVNYAAQIC